MRNEFLLEFPNCWICGAPSTGVHEITRGANRLLGFVDRATWMATCSVCNCDHLTDTNEWPVARQLAVKMLNDWGHFEIVTINEIMGRGPLAITMSEVISYLELSCS